MQTSMFGMWSKRESEKAGEYRHADMEVVMPQAEDVESDSRALGRLVACDRFELVDTVEGWQRVLTEMQGASCIALDTETEGLGKLRHRIIGLCLSYRRDGGGMDWDSPCSGAEKLRNVYVPVRHRTGCRNVEPELVFRGMRQLVLDPAKTWLFWNAKYDWHMIANEDIAIPHRCMDGMLFRRLCLPEERAGLKVVADEMEPEASAAQGLLKVWVQHLNRLNKWKSSRSPVSPSRYEYIPTDVMAGYAARDTYYTWLGTEKYAAQVATDVQMMEVARVEHRIIRALYEMERQGLYVDRVKLDVSREKIVRLRDEAEQKIRRELLPKEELPNLASSSQLAEFLQAKGVKLTRPTKSTRHLPAHEQKMAVDSTTLLRLEKAGSELAGHVREWKQANDLLSKYIDAFPKIVESDGCLHTSFRQAGTESGRMSSSGPNLQNMPSRGALAPLVKDVFTVHPMHRGQYVWIFADLSQIEIRVLAHYSREPALVEGYQRGLDVHAGTAADMFGERWEEADAKERKYLRSIGKQLNFSIVYGVSALGLSDILFSAGVTATHAECQQYIDMYLKSRPRVGQWIEEQKRLARRQGYIRNAYGRLRDFSVLHSPISPGQIAAVERELVNYTIQGTAADLYKVGLAESYRGFHESGIRGIFANTIHDEVQYYVHRQDACKSMEIVRHAFEVSAPERMDCIVPIVMDFEYSEMCWSDKKDVTDEQLREWGA